MEKFAAWIQDQIKKRSWIDIVLLFRARVCWCVRQSISYYKVLLASTVFNKAYIVGTFSCVIHRFLMLAVFVQIRGRGWGRSRDRPLSMKYNCKRNSHAYIIGKHYCVVFCANSGTSVPGGRQPGQIPPVGDDVDLEGGSAVWKKNPTRNEFHKDCCNYNVVITTGNVCFEFNLSLSLFSSFKK